MPKNNNIVGLGVNMPVMINLAKRPDDVAFDIDSFDCLGIMAGAQLALIRRAGDPLTPSQRWFPIKANEGVAVGFGVVSQKLSMEVVNEHDDAGFCFVSTEGEVATQKLVLAARSLMAFWLEPMCRISNLATLR